MTLPQPKMLHESQYEFAQAVKRNGGKVIVLVHPLFVLYAPRVFPPGWYTSHLARSGESLPSPKPYFRTLLKLRNGAKQIPVVVLEEHGKVSATHRRLKKAEPFYVETMSGDAAPVAGWQALHKSLQGAGVKTILLGGMFAYSASNFTGPPDFEVLRYERTHLPHRRIVPVDAGCLGDTYKQMIMAGHGKVRLLPGVLFPDKPIRQK